MTQTQISLIPRKISEEILNELDSIGLIMSFKPTKKTLNPPPGENVGEDLYVSDSAFGAHKLIAVGVNKTKVRLGVHSDNEEFLIPMYEDNVKPLYLVISLIPEDEIRRMDREGSLSEADFICVSLYPSPRGAEMFTMLKGTVHCELTTAPEGNIGVFFVTEGSSLDVNWIDLENTVISVNEGR